MFTRSAAPTIQTGKTPLDFATTSRLKRDLWVRRMGKAGLSLLPLFVYLFLWAPIAVLIIFSFNDSSSVAAWRGFTTRWYQNILNNTLNVGAESAQFSTTLMLNSLKNTLFVATVATATATVIGTMLALSLGRGNFRGKRALDATIYLPVVIPEITQGISLAIFFKLIFEFLEFLLGDRWTRGFGTIIIAHVAFNISYVAIVVRARLVNMNPHLEEAARDLGANEWRAFWRVTFPLLMPTTLFVLINALINAVRVIDHLFILTKGGPNNATNLLLYYVYETAFSFFDQPDAATVTVTILAILAILAGVKFRIIDRRVHYQ